MCICQTFDTTRQYIDASTVQNHCIAYTIQARCPIDIILSLLLLLSTKSRHHDESNPFVFKGITAAKYSDNLVEAAASDLMMPRSTSCSRSGHDRPIVVSSITAVMDDIILALSHLTTGNLIDISLSLLLLLLLLLIVTCNCPLFLVCKKDTLLLLLLSDLADNCG